MKDQRGIALIIVLWGVTLLALLAASLAQSGGLAARRSLNAVRAAQARARLDEAMAAAVLALARPERPWRADGSPHRLTLAGASAEIRASAEAGRIDLNHAAPALLQSWLRRESGDDEAGDRLAQALARRIEQRPLVAVGELATLPGMTAPLYRRLAAVATVHNPSGHLDWRLAADQALAAIPGLSEQQVATLVARRWQSQYTPDPAIAEIMSRVGAGADPDPASSGGARMVTLRMIVTLAGGGRASAEALLFLAPDGPPLRLLQWHAPADEAS